MIEITATGAANLAKWLDAANARSRKALHSAIKVEGFRLMTALRRELKAGAPGGRPFAPLSVIAAVRRGKYGDRTPLWRLASKIFYLALPDEIHIGFVQPARGARISPSWRRLALRHQEGFWHGMDEATRANIIRQLKYAPGPARRYFALRQSTRRFHTPARPIVEPFWQAHRRDALAHIHNNFRRKIAGERI